MQVSDWINNRADLKYDYAENTVYFRIYNRFLQ